MPQPRPPSTPLDYEIPPTRKQPRFFGFGTLSLSLALLVLFVMVLAMLAMESGRIRGFAYNIVLEKLQVAAIVAVIFGVCGVIQRGVRSVAWIGLALALIELVLLPSLFVA